eukprot:Gb_08544 [translate_table: standard]
MHTNPILCNNDSINTGDSPEIRPINRKPGLVWICLSHQPGSAQTDFQSPSNQIHTHNPHFIRAERHEIQSIRCRLRRAFDKGGKLQRDCSFVDPFGRVEIFRRLRRCPRGGGIRVILRIIVKGLTRCVVPESGAHHQLFRSGRVSPPGGSRSPSHGDGSGFMYLDIP